MLWLLLFILCIILAILIIPQLLGTISKYLGGGINENCSKVPPISGKILGESGVGEVYSFARDGKEYVVKVMSGVAEVDLEREFEIQKYLHQNGVNVPHVYEVFTCNGKQYFIMEKIAGKTLRELIAENKLDSIPDAAWRQYAEEVYKISQPSDHPKGVFHRDVNEGNVMYDGKKFYMIDFGPSKFVDLAHRDVNMVRFEDQQEHYYMLRIVNPRVADIIRAYWDEKSGGEFSKLWNMYEEPHWAEYMKDPNRGLQGSIFRKMMRKNKI